MSKYNNGICPECGINQPLTPCEECQEPICFDCMPLHLEDHEEEDNG